MSKITEQQYKDRIEDLELQIKLLKDSKDFYKRLWKRRQTDEDYPEFKPISITI
jgi:hypothetical protein